MGRSPSPTVRRRRMAARSRQLREAAGLTQDEAAEKLEWHTSKLFRVETMRSGLQTTDARALLDVYGVTDEAEREAFLQLSRDSRKRGWWQKYSDLYSGEYVGLEAETASIRTYENELVPGLLQTEDYARALLRTSLVTDPEVIERRIELRTARQRLLANGDPVEFWAVLGEAALRYRVGGPVVMRAQLDHLVKMSEQAHVTLQVLPFAAGAHMAMGSTFTILGFPESADQDVVFVENQVSALYLEEPKDVQRYRLVYDHLRTAALSRDDSRAMIAAAVRESK